MSLKQELTEKVRPIFTKQWEEREGKKVPEVEDLKLDTNEAVKLEAAVLYADLAWSTKMVDTLSWQKSAEIYKAFLACASRLIREETGVVTAYDGDRVMGVFFDGTKNSNAARCALKIKWSVENIVNPQFKAMYKDASFVVKSVVGVDTSQLRAARTGVRKSNDLVWVGRAANYAAKLSNMNEAGYHSYITETVYNAMLDEVKISSSDKKPMWEKRIWSEMNKMVIYRSSWGWVVH